jgi:O-antigen ligase
MFKSERVSSVAEWLCLLLLIGGFATMQVLIGGTRMVYSLPTYAVLGVAGIVALLGLRQRRPNPSTACLAVAAVFFAYILVRAWLSPVPYITRSDIYSVLGGLVVYYLTACVLVSARQRLAFVMFLLAVGVVHTLIGAVQFRDGDNWMPISWLQRYDYEARASGFYVCPNHLAGYLEVVAIIGLSVVCWSRWPVWSKLLIGYVVGVCYVGLVLTGSRGGYLSTATSIAVFGILSLLVLRRAGGRLFWTVSLAGLAAAVVAGGLLVTYVQKSDFLTRRAQKTFDASDVRLDLWQSALQQWQLQPVIGTGSGTYLFYGRMFRTERVQRDPVFVHNDYLHLLAEYGLVGAAGMLAFVGVHMVRGWRSFRRLGPKRVGSSGRLPSNALALNIGAQAAVASYVVHSVFDFNLHIPVNLLLMAFVFGLLANDGVIRESSSSSSTPPAVPRGQLAWRLVVPALGIVLLVMSLRLLPGEYFAERARAALRDQQLTQAMQFARRALEHDPRNPELYMYLGLARLAYAEQMEIPAARLSFIRAAVPEFQRAREIVPQDLTYALELAAALGELRLFEEAEQVYQDALRLDPRSHAVRAAYEAHQRAWQSPPPPEQESAAPTAAGTAEEWIGLTGAEPAAPVLHQQQADGS